MLKMKKKTEKEGKMHRCIDEKTEKEVKMQDFA